MRITHLYCSVLILCGRDSESDVCTALSQLCVEAIMNHTLVLLYLYGLDIMNESFVRKRCRMRHMHCSVVVVLCGRDCGSDMCTLVITLYGRNSESHIRTAQVTASCGEREYVATISILSLCIILHHGCLSRATKTSVTP